MPAPADSLADLPGRHVGPRPHRHARLGVHPGRQVRGRRVPAGGSALLREVEVEDLHASVGRDP